MHKLACGLLSIQPIVALYEPLFARSYCKTQFRAQINFRQYMLFQVVAWTSVPSRSRRLRQSSSSSAAWNFNSTLSTSPQMLIGRNRVSPTGYCSDCKYAHHRIEWFASFPGWWRCRQHGNASPHGLTTMRSIRDVDDLVRIDNNQLGTDVSFW